MSSFLHFPTTATLLILSLLSLSTAFVVDTDGDPLRNGGEYYITVRTSGASLTYTQKNDVCPLFITPTEVESLRGTPVRISTPLFILYIPVGTPVTLAFVSSSGTTPCEGSLEWKATLNPYFRKFFITTGGSDKPGNWPFKITKRDRSLLPTYELQYCGSSTDKEVCPDVGLFEEDGLLGITENPTTISFKKAFSVLEMSTS